MGISARLLGRGIGLTAQEMNALLAEHGSLDGKPGAYFATDKGEKYAVEQDHHRGPGGYSWYNRDWTTRTWDPSITAELDVSEQAKQHAREQVAEARTARQSSDDDVERQLDDVSDGPEPDARSLLLVAGVIATSMGLYKAAPRIHRFVSEKVTPELANWMKRSTPEAAESKNAIPESPLRRDDPNS